MAFVQVDPSQIKFDAPQAPQSVNGFVQVDPSQIKFDAPSTMEDVGKSAASGVAKVASYGLNPMGIVRNIAAPVIQGATRLAGAGYEAAGGELSPAAAQYLTYPIGDGNDVTSLMQDKILPVVVQAKTGMNMNYQPQTFAGNATKKAIETAPYLMGGEASALKTAVQAAGSGIGSQAGQEIAKSMGAGDKGQQIGSLLGGGLGLGAPEALNATKDVAGGIVNSGQRTFKGAFGTMSPDELAATQVNLGNDTAAAYKAIDNTPLTDQSANGLAQALVDSYNKLDVLPQSAPKTVAMLQGIYDRIINGKTDPFTGEVIPTPLAVSEIDGYRKQLSRASYGEDIAAAGAARSTIDKYLNGLSESDFAGGNTGNAINQLNSARATAAKEFTFNDLSEIATKSGGSADAIKRNISKYLADNPRGLTDGEKAILQDAANKGILDKALRGLGTFGFDLGKAKNVALPAIIADQGLNAAKAGAAAWMPSAGIPLVGAGTIARMGRTYGTRGGLQNAMDAVLSRDTAVTPSASPVVPPATSPPLALPAPQSTVVVNPAGQAVMMTPATREILGQSPVAPTPVTLQQIMRMNPADARAELERYGQRLNERR